MFWYQIKSLTLKMKPLKRQCIKLINEYLSFFPCVAIIGPRQCGKTTLLNEFKKTWKIYDLEKGADYDYISNNPDLFFRLNSEYIAIDEAQILPALFKALRVAIDKKREQTGRFIITGSSSPELLESIAESLAGRVGIIELSPFSLSEIINIKHQKFYDLFRYPETYNSIIKSLKSNISLNLIHDYWFHGGYPEPVLKKNERFYELWNMQYIKTYLERDISNLFPALNKQRFRQFIEFLSGLSGQIINYSDIARSLNVSQPTIKKYFKIAHGTFIWRQILPYEKNVTKRIIKHPKGYLRDSGLLHYLMRIRDIKHLLTHPKMGLTWESMVIEEVLRGLNCRGIPYNYFYYRTLKGVEIDLILEGKFGIIPVEIKYYQNIKSGSLRGIKDFIKEHHCRFGIIINNDEEIRFFDKNLIGIPFSYCV